MENSESGVEAGANETLSAMDVHVEGVSEDNTTPIIVTLKEATEKGYNKGNLSLFHVEDGVAVEMEEVETKADLIKHNQFTYDPADGTIAVALANFSEITLVANTEKPWNGELDFGWYDPAFGSYTIANADQLAAFGMLVGGMAEGYERDSFEGKTVKLISDINLNDAETNNQSHIFYPIGYYFTPDKEGDGTNVAYSTVYSFEGVFDGNGHTVANFYQNTWEIKGDYNDGYPAGSNYYKDGFGLFGYVYNGTVKNLIVSNFTSDGEFTPTGIVAAYAGGESTFENINVFNCTPRVYQTADGGIVGLNSSNTEKCKLTFRNITVDQSNTLSALWGNWGLAAGNIMGWLRGNPENEVIMENCHAAAVMDVNNDICGNYHWYLYRYAGMYIGTIDQLITDVDGRPIADLSGITAIDCTATFGSWNEYWYCELVENTIASYTHDHQFSRLERINSLSDIQDANGNWLRTGNFVIAKAADTESAVCYHVRKDANGNLYEHKHEDAGYETFDLNGDGELNDLKEDRQHYYVPFNQLFNGYGDGIKPIYAVNPVGEEADPYPNIDIEIIEDGTVMSQEKFQYVGPEKITENAAVSIGELWDALNDDIVSRSTVQVFVSPASEDSTVSAVYAAGVPDWESGTLTFSGTGLARITITDYYYCSPTIAYVEVGAEEPVDKFVATNVNKQLVYGTSGLEPVTVTLDELFDVAEGQTIDDTNITVTTTGTYTPGATWAEGTVTFGVAGTYTVTINDNNLCNDATATVTVADADPVEKFDLVFPNTESYLYRVGNKNAVAFSKLFTKVAGVKTDTISVDVEPVSGSHADGSYDAATQEITFTGTGVVKVTVTDNDYCIPTELYLEVVDATNVTGVNGGITDNVVLLNNCGVPTLTVSGDYTFYGNGFTMTYSGDGRYLNNGLKAGVVTVSENGTLDNVRIVAPIYPSAYLYFGSNSFGEAVQDGPYEVDSSNTSKIRYYYQLSAVAVSDNATISNCYIYGGRNNIFVDTGDVTIQDTVMECGVVANMQIQSNASHTVTLEDITTIQYQVHPTIGDTSKVMLGVGVLVGPETTENPIIVLNGDIKQYNWVTADDANAVSDTKITKAIINGAVNATAYNHTVNGKTASNLGIIYMNEAAAPVQNNTGLPYKLGDISITVSANTVTGQVCSLMNASADQIHFDYANADKSTENGWYEPQFKFDDTLGGQKVEDNGGDEFCYTEGKTVKVLFVGGDTKVLDLAALVDITKYTGQDLSLQIACVDENGASVPVTGGKVSLTDAGEYTVTYTVTDTVFYDKDGQTVTDTKTYNFNITLSVSLKDVSVPDARFDFNKDKQKMGYYKPAFGDVKQYLPFLAGLKIYDYNGQEEYLRFDGDADFAKVASVTITGYASNKASVEVKLTDGGVIYTQFLARANSGGASTYTGSIKTRDNVIYFVNAGGTSNSASTTTSAYWYVDYYKFIGNNGVEITSAQQTFNSSGSSASTPSGSFSTTIKYTVTFDANEGTCAQTVGYATSASAAITLPQAKRSGYMFEGWYTEANGGTKVGGAGDSYTPSADVTLYAQWGVPSIVTYNANGGSCDTASAQYGGVALVLPTPTRDGYWFTGWFTAASGGTKVGGAGDTYRPGGDTTLYAQWSPVYTVTYHANGGNVAPASAEYKGTALTLPLPTKSNASFIAWNTALDGSGTAYKAGASYIPVANVILYAQWEDPKVVTYDATTNGGSCTTTSQTYLGSALVLPTPDTRTGYTFNGWFTAASGGNKAGDAGASYTPTANITLYAQWSKTPYTINVTTSSASVSGVTNGQTAYYGDSISVTVSFSGKESFSLKITNDATNATILEKTAAGTYTFTMPAANVTISASSSCITPDTLITLADGSQVRVDSLTGDEELLVWNLETGCLDSAPVMFVDSEAEAEYEIVHLYFSDGTDVKVIYEHGFWDYDLNRYVYLDKNAGEYIGHTFAKQNGDTLEMVQLTDVVLETEVTTAWSPVTKGHLCYFVNGMLSMPGGVGGLFNIFEVDPETMTYDFAKMAEDIETYRLFTYEELNEIAPLSETMFEEAGGAYLKISIGKGNMTLEELTAMITRYSKFFE
ncbi:MAG: InlB B-repeat-containing protein [Clostridia bacterium]|nr:InlB B-repeat-containing protein [Clostridia bacterium]